MQREVLNVVYCTAYVVSRLPLWVLLFTSFLTLHQATYLQGYKFVTLV